jgi:hypothetical protein
MAAQNAEIVGRIMTKRECGFNWEMALGVWSCDSWVNQIEPAKDCERRVFSRQAEQKGGLLAGEVINRHWIPEARVVAGNDGDAAIGDEVAGYVRGSKGAYVKQSHCSGGVEGDFRLTGNAPLLVRGEGLHSRVRSGALYREGQCLPIE